ncbi:MAG TPA: hypothetical protein PKH07_18280, partial [bacterium]|nr:hypothetical protein [bacterium]
PSWESTRAAIFMKTDSRQPDSWLLEDVQLQCEMAAETLKKAIALGKTIRVPDTLSEDFNQTLTDLDGWRKRTLSYAYHLRETNLARMMRMHSEKGQEIPEKMLSEMRAILQADLENQDGAEPCRKALELLEKDLAEFLRTYFVVPEPATDPHSLGPFTLTSR